MRARCHRAVRALLLLLFRPDAIAAQAPDQLRRFEQYALTHAGDPDRGRALFASEQTTKCLVCHRVEKQECRHCRQRTRHTVLTPASGIWAMQFS